MSTHQSAFNKLIAINATVSVYSITVNGIGGVISAVLLNDMPHTPTVC